MTPSEFLTQMLTPLNKLTDRLAGQSDSGTLSLAGQDSTMNLQATNPVAIMDVAETDGEVTTIQGTSTTRFVDYRDTTLWEDDGGWSSSSYTGDQPFLRPGTLCWSPWSKKMYYVDLDMTMFKVVLSNT